MQLIIAVLKVAYSETKEFYERHPIVPERKVELNIPILIELRLYGELKRVQRSGAVQEDSFAPTVVASKALAEVAELKLLSGRQQNMVEKYKQKMRASCEDASWGVPWLFPKHSLQRHMRALVRSQEDNFLKYYDLSLYYRFRSMDFLSLRLRVHDAKPYLASSERQVLDDRWRRREEAHRVEAFARVLPFHYAFVEPARRAKWDRFRLPLRRPRRVLEFDGDGLDVQEVRTVKATDKHFEVMRSLKRLPPDLSVSASLDRRNSLIS